jgi:hypothetical protein
MKRFIAPLFGPRASLRNSAIFSRSRRPAALARLLLFLSNKYIHINVYNTINNLMDFFKETLIKETLIKETLINSVRRMSRWIFRLTQAKTAGILVVF